MFTGLIETVGRLSRVDSLGQARRLTVSSSLPASELNHGDSIAVDGICLTVVGTGEGTFVVEVIPETLRCSTLGTAEPGRRLNLERALRLGGRLGGHLLQGHVDASQPVVGLLRAGEDYRLQVALGPPIAPYVALKGSIALNGVSLTVAGLADGQFEVALIRETLERTTLSDLRPGDRVHVEVDLVARYLESLLAGRSGTAPPRVSTRSIHRRQG